MMKLARILHFHGFHITFVNTNYNRCRFLRSHGPHSLAGLPSFMFASIPDGLPPTSADADATQHIPSLCVSMERNSPRPFTDLLRSLNHAAEKGDGPRVTCIVSDAVMPFTVEAAEELGIKLVMFWPAGASSLLGCAQYRRLVHEDVVPFKDANFLTNGCLEKPIEGIPAMKGMRLKDIPSFIRTTDPKDIMLNHLQYLVDQSKKATAIIFNTYYDLDCDVLASLASDFPPLYPVGPLHFLEDQLHEKETESMVSSLWKADPNCHQWLDSQQSKSVVYVNFGSITVITNDQLMEFAWGLANSCKSFLWIIRPDLVTGESPTLPHKFVEVTKGRSFLASWCDQERS